MADTRDDNKRLLNAVNRLVRAGHENMVGVAAYRAFGKILISAGIAAEETIVAAHADETEKLADMLAEIKTGKTP